jgi:flagellar protein FliO/FliZ
MKGGELRMSDLFGAEMPLAVRFFLAFLVVLGLIGAFAWAVRRFGAGRLGGGSARGRQPRLAVVDYASVDGRRRLVLVRRDNVEHLMMIGGPTDVVVEANIVRATAASPRDIGVRPTAGLDALPRAIPLPENGGNGVGSWPLAPEPAPAPAPRATPRIEPLPDDLPIASPRETLPRETPRAIAPAAEPSARPQRDTLAALADELSTRQAQRRASRQIADEPQQDARNEPYPEPVAPRRHAAAPAATPVDEDSADQSLADMAQRLESALRKPGERAAPEAAPAPQPAPMPRVQRPEPKAPRAVAAEPKPGQAKAGLYDSLEQEMASLLGRPTKN